MRSKNKRLEVIALVKAKVLKQSEAANVLGISVRQVKRLCRAEREQGSIGLNPKRHGQAAVNRISDIVKQKIIELAQSTYLGFGPTFMAEKLNERDGITLGKESLRQILMIAGLWKGKQTKKISVHQRRERRACFGELVQIDGSPHSWFEKRGPKCCLILFIDDATSSVLYAQLEPAETTAAYFRGMMAHLKCYGIPLAYYSDKHMIFRVGNAKTIEVNDSQFERACNELGIEGICANSPQAKGRVERSNRTFQDRLVKEFRLAEIDNIEDGNKFLQMYIPKHNKKFSVCAREPNDVHVKALPDDMVLELILSMQSKRKLSKNLEIGFENKIYQVVAEKKERRLQQSVVTVCKMLNNNVNLLSSVGEQLHYKTFSVRTKQVIDKKSLNTHIDNLAQQKRNRPPANHPWRKYQIKKSKGNLPISSVLA
jgi:transposase